MLVDVTCAHCGAANQINAPDDHTGPLRWECTPCGRISQHGDAPVGVTDDDAGSSVDVGG